MNTNTGRTVRIAFFLFLTSVVVSAQSVSPARQAAADFVQPGPVERLAAPLAATVDGLRAASLAAHIAFLASPAMEGRALAGRGLDAAAEYIAANLALAGIPPMTAPATGPPGAAYFQQVPLREISRPGGQLTIETRRGDASEANTFASGIDCVFPERAPTVVSGPIVFAGYGIRETTRGRDDYRDLDVRGKTVVILGGLPAGADWKAPEMISRYGAASGRPRFAAKLELAASRGARAVVAIETGDAAVKLAGDASVPAPTFFLPYDDQGPSTPLLVRVSPRVGDAILAGANAATVPVDNPAKAGSHASSSGIRLQADCAASVAAALAAGGAPCNLTGVTATIRLTGDERLVMSRNVVAAIRGSDAKLAGDAVVIGAHMDHLGRSGETIYPGADDNASGVAALIEIAKALAARGDKPKRTVVFTFWTGEEEGHLGSGYYVRHPLWPVERTSVYLNLDMIGHPWTSGEIQALVADTHLEQGEAFLAQVKPADFIELGVADRSPDLLPVLARAGRGTGLAMHFDRTDGKSGGSDYREFARRDVPFVRFFGNYFDGYHEPSDTVDRVDAGQVLKMARLALASAWLLADR